MRHVIDLSHVIEAGTITYPGIPAPAISEHLGFDESHDRYAPGTEFRIARIDMAANTGTYLDTPAHRFRDGWDLDSLPLERVVEVPALVIDAADTAIGVDVLAGHDLAGKAVLVRTGWSRHWGTDTYGAGGHPYLVTAAVDALVAAGPALVGIDSLNIDGTATGERPAHTGLLRAGIPVVEHLTNLEALPHDRAVRVTMLPPAIRGMGTFTVRAVAVWDD